MTYRFAARVARLTLAPGLALLLAACGGGGSDAPTPVLPTPVPENLSITAPASGDIAEPTAFGNSAAGLSKLIYSWDFGDGSAASTEAAPKHVFAKPGEYEVKLRVSNEAGQAKEVKATITVNNQAAVRGLECSGAAETGWCWQAPRPNGHEPISITFANATTGWSVGAFGEIFKTADGGKTWVRQRSGVTVDLTEVVFWDDKTGWILGRKSTLLGTRDGGSTWTVLAAPWGDSLGGDGLIVQSERSIEYDGYTTHRSDDGGLTWQPWVRDSTLTSVGDGAYLAFSVGSLLRYSSLGAEPVEVLQLKDSDGTLLNRCSTISSVGDKSVIVCAYGSSVERPFDYRSRVLWRSEDQGKTWIRLPATGLSLGLPMDSLEFRSFDAAGQVLLASRPDRAFRSEDGGFNWAPVALGGSFDFRDLIVQGARAFARGNYKHYFSDDLGKTWKELNVPQPFVSGSNGDYDSRLNQVGAGLLLDSYQHGSFVSLDKGRTWVRQSASRSSAPQTVAFRDAKNGFLVNNKSELLHSSDGGKSWTLKRSDLGRPDPLHFWIASLKFVNAKTAYLVGQDQRLYKSKDGGETWTLVVNSTQWNHVHFTDELNGWGFSENNYDNVWLTRDGANSWNELTLPFRYFSELRVDAGKGLTGVGSFGRIAQSSDDGKTWSMRDSGLNEYLNRVYSRDGKSYWVLGRAGTVLRSDDGGLTWAKVSVPSSANLLDVQFADAKNGWIVGEQGTILATRDGGKTWMPQESGTRKTLRTVQLIDSRTGWIVGDQGTLLATGTGGY